MQNGGTSTWNMVEDPEIYEVLRTREIAEHDEVPGEWQALKREHVHERHRMVHVAQRRGRARR